MILNSAKTLAILANMLGKSDSVAIGVNGSCYLGLFTTLPGTGGTGYAEPTGNNYSRREISSFMSNNYQSHVDQESSASTHARRYGNTEDIVFPEAYVPSNPDASTGGEWGTILGWGLFSTKATNSLYCWGSLSNQGGVTINTHNVFVLRKGYFELELADGGLISAATASVT